MYILDPILSEWEEPVRMYATIKGERRFARKLQKLNDMFDAKEINLKEHCKAYNDLVDWINNKNGKIVKPNWVCPE